MFAAKLGSLDTSCSESLLGVCRWHHALDFSVSVQSSELQGIVIKLVRVSVGTWGLWRHWEFSLCRYDSNYLIEWPKPSPCFLSKTTLCSTCYSSLYLEIDFCLQFWMKLFHYEHFLCPSVSPCLFRFTHHDCSGCAPCCLAPCALLVQASSFLNCLLP